MDTYYNLKTVVSEHTKIGMIVSEERCLHAFSQSVFDHCCHWNTSTLFAPFVSRWVSSCFHNDGRPQLFSRKWAKNPGSALARYLLAEDACYHGGRTTRLRHFATDAVVGPRIVGNPFFSCRIRLFQ